MQSQLTCTIYNIVDILTKANPYIRAQIAKPEFDLSVFMHAGREFLIPEKIKNVRCRLLDGALYAREDLLLADAISGDVSLSGDDIILSSLKGSSFAGDISLEGAYEAATLHPDSLVADLKHFSANKP